MDIPSAEPWTKSGQHGDGIWMGPLLSFERRWRHLRASVFTDPEIGSDEQMKRRMPCPVRCQLFDLEERHLVDYGVAIATGGGEDAVNFSPVVTVPEIVAEAALFAPDPIPGAGGSPAGAPPGFRPEPVSTAFSTELALPTSSRFSTFSGVISG